MRSKFQNNRYGLIMHKFFNVFCVACILTLTMLFTTGCTEAEKKSIEISKEADTFQTPRKLTVINTRTDTVILEFIGTFSVQSSDGAIDILCAIGDDEYEKHFFTLNEWTIYVVEDISSNGGDLYFRQIKYYPENV